MKIGCLNDRVHSADIVAQAKIKFVASVFTAIALTMGSGTAFAGFIDGFDMTRYHTISPGVETLQSVTRRYEGETVCWSGSFHEGLLDVSRFSIEIEVNYHAGPIDENSSWVYIANVSVNNADVDTDVSTISPQLRYLDIYDNDQAGQGPIKLDDYLGQHIAWIDSDRPLRYYPRMSDTFTVSAGKPVVIQLNIGTTSFGLLEICRLSPILVLQFGEKFKTMYDMKDSLSTVLDSDTKSVQAAWVAEDALGIIHSGNKYTILSLSEGKVLRRGGLNDADTPNFWKNAPAVPCHENGCNYEHHPTKRGSGSGISAGWIYQGYIGFLSSTAYWNSKMVDFQDPNVWNLDTSNSGQIYGNDFWDNELTNNEAIGLPADITAGMNTVDDLFVAFSYDTVFPYSKKTNSWLFGKSIDSIDQGEPFSFLKDAPIPEGQNKHIHAAFYNPGGNEYVFFGKNHWYAYTVPSDNEPEVWTFGTLYSE